MKMEFTSSTPIYIQIIDEIKREIVSGDRKPGSKVEPVRDMAQSMGVNPNTVQRAFAQLEREGLMFTERTSGRYITTDEGLISSVKEGSVMQNVAEFVSSAALPFPYDPEDGREILDEDDPDFEIFRVIRGGMAAQAASFGLQRTVSRLDLPTNQANGNIGFRCARDWDGTLEK